MIQKYQKQALSTGASIIPFSGFDSIPSEVSSIKSIDQYRKKYNADPSKIEHLYFAKGGFNGGTIASAFNFSDKVSLKDFLNDHFLINNSKKIKDISKTKYFPSLKLWGSPFFMESVNSKVVFFSLSNKRENDIIKALEYSEHINLNKKSGKITHKIGTGFMNSANLLMAKKFGQTILRPFLPSPGQGPSEKSINEGFFKLTTITSGKEGEIISKMNGRGDPGNKVTVNCMLSVLDSLLETPNPTAGFLTPFSCFGEQIVQNLEKHEIFYEGIK